MYLVRSQILSMVRRSCLCRFPFNEVCLQMVKINDNNINCNRVSGETKKCYVCGGIGGDMSSVVLIPRVYYWSTENYSKGVLLLYITLHVLQPEKLWVHQFLSYCIISFGHRYTLLL